MPEPRRVISLPDGRTINCTSSAEAMYLWRTLTNEGLYDRLAASLRTGDVVLDVGANVGLAAMKLFDRCPGVQIVAVEPAPLSFACLRDNLARHVPGAQAVCAAVADDVGRRTLVFYPEAPANSSLYPDPAADERAKRVYLRNRGLPDSLIDQLVSRTSAQVAIPVPVVTVSALLRDLGLDRLDAIKIDVERAELEVLQGIAPEHWLTVRHVSVEVHDEGGRLARCRELLQRVGMDIHVSQEPGAEGTALYELDASRRPPGVSPADQ